MSEELPDCKDFIIEAIRTIRLSPSNLKEGTAAGVALHRLWLVASEVYQETDFRAALKELIGAKILVATCTISRYSAHGSAGPFRKGVVTDISENMDFSERVMYRALDGSAISQGQRATTEHDYISGMKLYIVADGLPGKLGNSDKKKAGARAAQILAGMK